MLRAGAEAGAGEKNTHVDDGLLQQHDHRHWLADDGDLEEDAGLINQDSVQSLARSSKLGWGRGQSGFKLCDKELYLVECSIDLVSVRPRNRTKPIQIRDEVLARLDNLGVASNEVLRSVSKFLSRLGNAMSFDEPGTGLPRERSGVH